ncbi:MAG: hypothetical protein JWR56_1948 [Massilia sp.]|nr:hypothetical protein [Massilia sp.]
MVDQAQRVGHLGSLVDQGAAVGDEDHALAAQQRLMDRNIARMVLPDPVGLITIWQRWPSAKPARSSSRGLLDGRGSGNRALA